MGQRTLGFAALAGTLAALALFASAPEAHAERWWGSNICLDLDSVRIVTDPSTSDRLVAFVQRPCAGGNAQWWAVPSDACKQPNVDGSDLLQYQNDSRIWMPPMFAAGLDKDAPEVLNAGVACNWAHPSLFGVDRG